jgi:hypothetical protein
MDDDLMREVADEYLGYMGPKAPRYFLEQARIASGRQDREGADLWCRIAKLAWRLHRSGRG